MATIKCSTLLLGLLVLSACTNTPAQSDPVYNMMMQPQVYAPQPSNVQFLASGKLLN